MILTRRSLLSGFAGLLAAPAIVRASSLMPVKTFHPAVASGPLFDISGMDEWGNRIRETVSLDALDALGVTEINRFGPVVNISARQALIRRRDGTMYWGMPS